MSLIRFQNVTFRYEDRPVLRSVYFKIQEGERVGLIGKNGAGKSTLLNLILGRIEPTEGKVDQEQGLRIGYFSQFSELDGAASVQEVLDGLFTEVRGVETELAEIGTALETVEDADEMTRLLDRQGHLLEEMARLEGWDVPRHIDTALTKLGFNAERRALPIDRLSGGWRNRAALAKILLERPDVLLLDEPTNYLDVEGLAWLEGWLNQFRGGLLLVSHDRQFLDAVATRIIEVENYGLQEYEGGFTDYIREKPFRLKTLERQWQHEEELLLMEAEAVADQAESRKNPDPGFQRKLADLKKRRAPRPLDVIVTQIYQGLHAPDQLLEAEGLSKSYGGPPLFADLDFHLHKDDRLAIVGPNGSGKSTLLRIITGEEAPDTGRLTWLSGAKFASFNALFADLDLSDTAGHAVNTYGLGFHAQRKQVHKFLEMLQFSEADLAQKIGALSGGQRARIALAKCLLSGASCLVLDEPTNHLDLASAQVMERALAHFPGAVIVVSHDRFFLDKVATRLLVFEPGGVREVTGNWSVWQASLSGRG